MLVLVGISANTKVQQETGPQPPHNGLLNKDCQPDSPGPENGLDGSLHSSVSHFMYQTLQYAFSPFPVVGRKNNPNSPGLPFSGTGPLFRL